MRGGGNGGDVRVYGAVGTLAEMGGSRTMEASFSTTTSP